MAALIHGLVLGWCGALRAGPVSGSAAIAVWGPKLLFLLALASVAGAAGFGAAGAGGVAGGLTGFGLGYALHAGLRRVIAGRQSLGGETT